MSGFETTVLGRKQFPESQKQLEAILGILLGLREVDGDEAAPLKKF